MGFTYHLPIGVQHDNGCWLYNATMVDNEWVSPSTGTPVVTFLACPKDVPALAHDDALASVQSELEVYGLDVEQAYAIEQPMREGLARAFGVELLYVGIHDISDRYVTESARVAAS